MIFVKIAIVLYLLVGAVIAIGGQILVFSDEVVRDTLEEGDELKILGMQIYQQFSTIQAVKYMFWITFAWGLVVIIYHCCYKGRT